MRSLIAVIVLCFCATYSLADCKCAPKCDCTKGSCPPCVKAKDSDSKKRIVKYKAKRGRIVIIRR